jgi:hypothetical protein
MVKQEQPPCRVILLQAHYFGAKDTCSTKGHTNNRGQVPHLPHFRQVHLPNPRVALRKRARTGEPRWQPANKQGGSAWLLREKRLRRCKGRRPQQQSLPPKSLASTGTNMPAPCTHAFAVLGPATAPQAKDPVNAVHNPHVYAMLGPATAPQATTPQKQCVTPLSSMGTITILSNHSL